MKNSYTVSIGKLLFLFANFSFGWRSSDESAADDLIVHIQVKLSFLYQDLEEIKEVVAVKETGILGHQPGWETVTKYRVDPGFYDVDLMIFANLQRWNELSEEAQRLIEDAALALEQDAMANDAKLNEEVAAKQVESRLMLPEALNSNKNYFLKLGEQSGVKLSDPSCGACIKAGPGVSDSPDQVTVSAINRNFPGRSGPGQVYLASPLVIAASAFLGHIGGPGELD